MKYQPNEEALNPLMDALEEKRQTYLSFRKAAKNLYLLPVGLFICCVLISSLHDISLFLCFIVCFGLGLFIKLKKVDSYTEDYNEAYKETLIKSFVPTQSAYILISSSKISTPFSVRILTPLKKLLPNKIIGNASFIDTVVLSTQHDESVSHSDLVEAVIEEIIKPVLPVFVEITSVVA